MLPDSQLLQLLEQHAFSPDGHPMCIYGDPAYPLPIHLQAPFRNAILTPQMEAFNMAMSDVRISVEWLFGYIVNYFKFLDYKTNLKIALSSVGKMYVVCALIRNALTCLYGNETSNYFGLEPPTLQEYCQSSVWDRPDVEILGVLNSLGTCPRKYSPTCEAIRRGRSRFGVIVGESTVKFTKKNRLIRDFAKMTGLAQEELRQKIHKAIACVAEQRFY